MPRPWLPASLRRLVPARAPRRVRPRVEALEDRRLPSTYTVTNTADSGTGSLRKAINNVNADTTADVINFNISGSGLHTISLLSPLPTITNSVTLDGYTQPGARTNTLATGSNAVLEVALNGAGAGSGANGLTVTAGNSTIQGLILENFSGNAVVLTNGASGNVVQGNFIGNTGGAAAANGGGVLIQGAFSNTVGGTTDTAANVISGNSGSGVSLVDQQAFTPGTPDPGSPTLTNAGKAAGFVLSTFVNTVPHNGNVAPNSGVGPVALGFAPSGNVLVGEYPDGILNAFSDTDNQAWSAGGQVGNYGNGNAHSIARDGDTLYMTKKIAGALVKLDPNTGTTTAVVNAGVLNLPLDVVVNPANHHLFVSTSSGIVDVDPTVHYTTSPPTFASQHADGLTITPDGSTLYAAVGNDVLGFDTTSGNVVFDTGPITDGGTNLGPDGTALGTGALTGQLFVNTRGGDLVEVDLNTLAQTILTTGGSRGDFVKVDPFTGTLLLDYTDRVERLTPPAGGGFSTNGNTYGNVIEGNYIGVAAGGTAALANGGDGVDLFAGASANTVGPSNVIAGNAFEGVVISDVGTKNNLIKTNTIGTNGADATGLGNGGAGVVIQKHASGNTVGGNASSSYNVISGNAGQGVLVTDQGTSGNLIQNNYIGTTGDGSKANANGAAGIVIQLGASNNTVGGFAAARYNVISGNTGAGVVITDKGTSGNLIQNNYIGTDGAGAARVANGGSGVVLQNQASGNTVGGNSVTASYSYNVISGNAADGVLITGAGTSGNLVRNNYLGTTGDGTAALANGDAGVLIQQGAGGNTVGGGSAANYNVISGNVNQGVRLQDANTSNNLVQNNYIGTNGAGTGAVANGASGVLLQNGASGNTIGGPNAATDYNVISGNGGQGVNIIGTGTSGNLVENNYIGTNGAGNAKVPNAGSGVLIQQGASGNTVGGNANTASYSYNVISGNGVEGVLLTGAGTSGNLVRNNYLGTAGDGSAVVANGDAGVVIQAGASGNTVGGGAASNYNVISGNVHQGVRITDAGTSNNLVQNNYIGTNGAGTAAVANGGVGVLVQNGASGNTVGGPNAATDYNVISGNAGSGVVLTDKGTSGNLVENNYIGTNGSGTAKVANGGSGVVLQNQASGNTVGGNASTASYSYNVISGNAVDGVLLTGAGTSGNLVRNNYLGTTGDGSAAVANGDAGVVIQAGASGNTVGGAAAINYNVISGNVKQGVRITDVGTSTNLVQNNYIGTNGNGTAVANGGAGVQIQNGASGNTVGGSAATDYNVISGNTGSGVVLTDKGTSANLVQNNYVGTNGAGTGKVANGGSGVVLQNQASGNTVGGGGSIAYNVISGNAVEGVLITGAGTSGNVVKNNYLGTTGDGSTAVANGDAGVLIQQGATGNRVGGTGSLAYNVISGNKSDGVRVTDPGTTGNVVLGNYIGTNGTGSAAVPNQDEGVLIETGAGSNTVGGTAAGAANVVSGNAFEGVYLSGTGTTGNVVLGNLIGLNGAGTKAIANGSSGVRIDAGSDNNTVGGTATGAGNFLSGNTNDGVVIGGAATTGNVVLGNFIGLNQAGTAAVPNGDMGVYVFNGANANTVGPANVISGNTHSGVYLTGAATSGNVVRGNLIGTTPSGLAALGNLQRGVFIDGAPGNVLGGTTAADRNVIAGNGYSSPLFVGVLIANSGATGNVVEGNYVGVGSDGTTALPNSDYGIRIGTAANNNTVGGTAAGAGNLIGANGGNNTPGHLDSVAVDNWNGTTFVGSPGVGNAIRHNAISNNPAGDNGIYLAPGANDNQPAPVLAPNGAGSTGGNTTVAGSLSAAPNTHYDLDFFASATSATAPPQGQTYLGTLAVLTDGTGGVSFTAHLTGVTVPAGRYVTATATNKGNDTVTADAGGDTSVFSAAVLVSTTAPAVTLTAPANGTFTNNPTPTFSGAAGTAPGDSSTITVTVYAGATTGGSVVETLTATASGGAWSVASPALAQGTYTAVAQQANSAGIVGTSAPSTFTIDTTPPAVTLTAPVNGTFTNNTTPALGGAAGTAAGDSSTITITVYAGGTASGSPVETLTATASNGAWSAASPALAEGTYTAVAQQADAAGNVGTSAPSTFTVDTTKPVVTLTQPANNSWTNTTTPTLGGAAGTAAGDSGTVTVKVYSGAGTGGSVVETLTAAVSAGAWSVVSPALGQGTYTAQAAQADAAGNVGTSGASTFTVDTTPPVVTLTAPANGSFTSNTAPTLSGTAGTAAGDLGTVTVLVYAGGTASGSPVETLTTTASGGAWSVASPALAEGKYTAVAQQSDAAGNVGTSAASTFTIDTTKPTVTLTAPANNSSVNTGKPTLSGGAGTAAGDLPTITVKVYAGSTASGNPVETLTATASGGAWSVASGALADGTYTAVAQQSDAAGNTGASGANTFTVDTVAPAVTLTAPANGAQLTTTAPTFSGGAGTAAGDLATITVNVYSGSTTAGPLAETLTATASGGAWSVVSPDLPAGTYTAVAQQSDAAGNTGSSSASTFTTSIPLTVTLTQPVNGSSINTGTPTFRGSAGTAPGDSSTITVKVYAGSGTGGAVVETRTTTASSGIWSVGASPALADGVYTAQAQQANGSGGTDLSGASTFTVDTTAPVVTLTAPAGNALLNTGTPTFRGSAGTASGDSNTITVKVFSGGTLVETLTATASSGNWSVASPSLGDGSYTAQAQQADAAGNVGFSGTNAFTIDTTPPAVTLTQPADNSATRNTTPTFGGSAGTATGDSGTVTVKVYSGAGTGGSVVETLTANVSAGAWSVASGTLAEGKYTAQAQQADAAGNVGLSGTSTFTVDTTAPAVTLTAPANGSSSNNTAPTFSGAAGTAAGDSTTITVLVYAGGTASGSPVETLTATASGGAWSAASPALAQGKYTAVAEQSDAAGNTGTSTASTFTINTTPPAVTLSQPAAGSFTKSLTPIFGGDAGTDPGDAPTVTVKVYGGAGTTGPLVETLTALVSGGSWSVVSPALAEGKYTAQATQADAAGNTGTSAANTFTVDTTAPVVTLAQPANGASLSTTAPTFGGSAGTASGDLGTVTVTVYAGGTATGSPVEVLTATVGSGSWSVAAFPPLAEGKYTAVAQQADSAGNVGTSGANTFTIDTTAPVVTLSQPLGGSFTNNAAPTFAGSAGTAPGDGATITVKVYSGGTTAGPLVETLTATASAGGWSVAAAPALAEGKYTVQAQQADAAGNVGTSGASTFTVDTTAPLVTLTAPAGGTFTNNTTPTFGGSAGTAAGDAPTITVKVYAGSSAAGTPVETLTANVNGGTWSADSAALPEGRYTAQAQQTDAAGNVGLSGTSTFAIDLTAPTVTLAQPAGGSATNVATPVFSGTAGTAPGDGAAITVKVYSGSTAGPLVETLPATASAGGWSVTSPTLRDGTYAAVAQQADAAGNVGSSAVNTFTVDTAAPLVTLLQPAGGAALNSARPTFGGSAGTASGDSGTVTVRVYPGSTASGSPVETLTAPAGSGAWSAPSAALPDGTYTVQAQQTDAAGNTGTSTANTFTVDTKAPAVTLTAPASGSSLNDPKPAFSGAAGTAAGDSSTITVKVYAGGSATGTPVQTLTATAGSGSWSVTAAAALHDGPYTAVAEQTDAAGNVGTSTTTTFTIDTAKPVVTLAQPAPGSSTNNPTPTLGGSAGTASGDDDTITVLVYGGGSAAGTPVETLTVSADGGVWSVDSPQLPDGLYTAVAQQADAAGNTGTSTANTFTVDTKAPTVTLTAPANNSSINTGKPTLGGAAGTAAGDLPAITVKIYSGSSATGTPVQTLTATAGSGSWSVTATTGLADGMYTAVAEQSDAAGNVGMSGTVTFTVDTVKPVVTLTQPAAGSSASDTTPTLGGNAGTASGDDGTVTVLVYAGTSAAGTPVETLTANVNGGAWSVDSPQLPQGKYTAVAQQADAAGNVGTSAPSTFTLDTTPPTGNVTPLPATTTTPTFTVSWSGTDTGGSGVTGYDVYVSVDGGPFSRFLTDTTQTSTTYPGAAGHSYGFAVVPIDAAGNHGAAPTTAQTTITVQQQTPPSLPRGITARLVTVKAGKGKKVLMVLVSFADTGAKKSEFSSPFQKPRYRAIAVGVKDSNGDGVPDQVVVTAKKGKRTVTATFAG